MTILENYKVIWQLKKSIIYLKTVLYNNLKLVKTFYHSFIICDTILLRSSMDCLPKTLPFQKLKLLIIVSVLGFYSTSA